MRTEKTYRPVMSGQSIWDPGPTRRQTTPRRRPPSRTMPTAVRCHTVSSSLNRPDGNPTNQPVNRRIHSRHLPKPTPHTYPLSAAPSNRPHTYRLSDVPPTQPIPITHQTRPADRARPCTQTTHLHSHTVTRPAPRARPTHPAPRTPPHAGHAARTAPATRTPHSTEQRARGSTEHRAPSTEHGARNSGAAGQHRAQSTRQ